MGRANDLHGLSVTAMFDGVAAVMFDGRGIAVCEEWRTFAGFLADMGKRPKGSSIDRIDNDSGYSKDNCRWASFAEQSQNRSSTLLSPDLVRSVRSRALSGESTREIAKSLGVSRQVIWHVVSGRTWNNVT